MNQLQHNTIEKLLSELELENKIQTVYYDEYNECETNSEDKDGTLCVRRIYPMPNNNEKNMLEDLFLMIADNEIDDMEKQSVFFAFVSQMEELYKEKSLKEIIVTLNKKINKKTKDKDLIEIMKQM